ncbi:hypothetical protein EVC45_42215 [Paraburkholderia sp. UYCP14C]|uniref:hypothetical protein n=1 Tax=Paraburkholderia sp. UYCP14C TaxID=2511130 RepID=UPI00102144DB|nr:hypothetical protein [Paraburkholderia sp. UYCP14C]RZF23811.1 hypothetical protein EVC45_42215 [Paraburkholderia sp. UYCP14C]
MTRVGTPLTTVAPATHTNAARERLQQTAVARFAVLYRGTIMFSYARTQHTAMRGSVLGRKLATLNARRRNAACRTGVRRPVVAAGDKADEVLEAGVGGSGRVTRDAGNGCDSGGQPHDERDGSDRDDCAPRALIRMRGQTSIARPAPGALQKFVAAQAPFTDLAETLPRLWCDALLAWHDEAAARPQAPLDAGLHERFIDLLAVQLHTGAPGDVSMDAWRQRLIEACESGHLAARGASVEGEASAEKISRAGRLNLLMPLLLLGYGRPSTPPMRERAMNVRVVQRGTALIAAERG